jgi:hypothetical protein
MTRSFNLIYKGKLELQMYIVRSERFSQLPPSQRIKLLARFSLQQWAYGDKQRSKEFLHIAHRENPTSVMLLLLQMLMLLGRPFTKLLVKGRNLFWKTFNR